MSASKTEWESAFLNYEHGYLLTPLPSATIGDFILHRGLLDFENDRKQALGHLMVIDLPKE